MCCTSHQRHSYHSRHMHTHTHMCISKSSAPKAIAMCCIMWHTHVQPWNNTAYTMQTLMKWDTDKLRIYRVLVEMLHMVQATFDSLAVWTISWAAVVWPCSLECSGTSTTMLQWWWFDDGATTTVLMTKIIRTCICTTSSVDSSVQCVIWLVL